MKRIIFYIIILTVFAFNISKANIELDTSIHPIVIKGTVLDSLDKNTLYKATIMVDSVIIAYTDIYGVFKINPSDIEILDIRESSKIKIAYTGYRTKVMSLKDLKNQPIIELDGTVCRMKISKRQRFKNWLKNLFN